MFEWKVFHSVRSIRDKLDIKRVNGNWIQLQLEDEVPKGYLMLKYSADLNYPDKTNKFEILNEFSSNWVKIRQKLNNPKIS